MLSLKKQYLLLASIIVLAMAVASILILSKPARASAWIDLGNPCPNPGNVESLVTTSDAVVVKCDDGTIRSLRI